jgi:S-formylglutathione hydrolase FrmB
MNSLKTIAGGGLALMLTFTAPVASGQSVPNNVAASGATGAYDTDWSTHDSVSLMDQNVSREIKQAWSEGKDATGAMAFQENGEIAMGEGKEKQARQYFQAAEQELRTLKPEGE